MKFEINNKLNLCTYWLLKCNTQFNAITYTLLTPPSYNQAHTGPPGYWEYLGEPLFIIFW